MSLPRSAGLHHVSAMARDPQRNIDFYQRVLGQRLIKTTVNYDDPGTYHLYYGDGVGTVGTALTFFPWPMAARGTRGTGETDALAYAVPRASLDWWRTRLADHDLEVRAEERFGDPLLAFEDPDGFPLELIGRAEPPETAPWEGGPVPAEHRLRGFFATTLKLADAGATGALLQRLGFVREASEGKRSRWRAARADPNAIGAYLDLLEIGHRLPGRYGAGSIHHVALRVDDDEAQAAALRELRRRGHRVTDVQERQYFRSIYFREPGGVLIEIATDGPGFTVDESPAELGSALRLPAWFEPRRDEIVAKLPPLDHLPPLQPREEGVA